MDYYSNSKSGIVELLTIEKNALKSDTSNYSQLFLYSRDSIKVGKIFYGDVDGFSIYINDTTYYVYNTNLTYYRSDASGSNHLEFLPFWEPKNFFFKYFLLGQKYGVETAIDKKNGNYILNFTNNSDGHFVFFIDSSKYSLIRYSERYTHKKFGDQYTEYAFSEKSSFIGTDTILNELDFVTKNYVQTTDKMIEEQAKSRKKLKEKLIGKKIDYGMLCKLMFGENYTQYANCYILLDYYYQTCLPCIKTISQLNELRSRFSDSSTLMIVGIDPMPEDVNQKEKFSKRYNILYPLVDGEQAMEIKKITLSGLSISYPTMVLIAPDGTIKKIIEYYSESHFRELGEYFKKHLR